MISSQANHESEASWSPHTAEHTPSSYAAWRQNLSSRYRFRDSDPVVHDSAVEEALISIFGKVLETAQDQETDAAFGCQVRKLLAERGGIEALTEQCDTVSALHRDNELPLLWPIHVRYRNLLFRLLDLMDIQSATQERSLLDALAVVSKHRHARRNELAEAVDIGFASQRWQSYVGKRRSGSGGIERRTLEVCVFVHLAEALQTGDLYVVGAEDFADYRAQLLSWSECERRLPAYCAALGISARGEEFASALKAVNGLAFTDLWE